MPASAKPARMAIIGCGDISRDHFAACKTNGIEVAAVCDLDPELAKRKVADHGLTGAEVFTDHRRLLERGDLDFVTVATPVAGHAPLTIAALRAGKHVMCEKPSALSLAENVAIRDAARAAGRKVVFFSARMRYGFAGMARTRIAAGDLGRIYRVEARMARRRGRPGVDIIKHARWFTDHRLAGGGVIMDMGQYYLDRIFHLTGWPAIGAISATSFRGFAHDLPAGATFDVEEQCSIVAPGADGCSFSCDFSWIGHQQPRDETIVLGTRGGIRIDNHDRERPFVQFRDGDDPWQGLDTTTTWRDDRSGSERMYGDFVRAIRGEDVEVGTTPDQAIAITRCTLMAQKSAELGREVRADEVPVPAAATAAG
jgi:predicted dehydrogenase